jgi:ABC-type long-subunit fatty acid transport system fused permease/ATPase subunit
MFSVVLERVHCGIYKSSHNVSSISCLNSHPPPIPGLVLKGIIFALTYMCTQNCRFQKENRTIRKAITKRNLCKYILDNSFLINTNIMNQRKLMFHVNINIYPYIQPSTHFVSIISQAIQEHHIQDRTNCIYHLTLKFAWHPLFKIKISILNAMFISFFCPLYILRCDLYLTENTKKYFWIYKYVKDFCFWE